MGKEIALILVRKYGCNVMGIARNKAKLDALKAEFGRQIQLSPHQHFRRTAVERFRSRTRRDGVQSRRVDQQRRHDTAFHAVQRYDFRSDRQGRQDQSDERRLRLQGNAAVYQKSRFGYICNVASASAILPVGGESIYSATKGGVWALTECLAQELRGFGIGVSCVMPGPVKTDIYKARESEGEKSDKADSLVETSASPPRPPPSASSRL